MKTLVIANQKGGVGKTASVVHIAFDFLERGLKVAVIDVDPQANASFTLKKYTTGLIASQMFNGVDFDLNLLSKEPGGQLALIGADAQLANLEKMELSRAAANFRASIKTLDSQGFDVCLIDTAPTLGNGMTSALLAGDYLLAPVEPEAYSIQGIKKLLLVVSNTRQHNKGLQFLGMLPSMVDGRLQRHADNLAELQRAYGKNIAPVSIGLRSSIAESAGLCVPVWEIKKTAARVAAKEMRGLAAFVYAKMEISQ